MPFYLQMSKNITQQRDSYDTLIFRFLQIFYVCMYDVLGFPALLIPYY